MTKMNSRAFFLTLLLSTVAFAGPPKTTKRLGAAEVATAAREAIALSKPKLPKKSTVTNIRCTTTPEVPVTISRVTIDVTPPPRKSGTVAATAVLTFYKENDVAARVPVTLDLDVPPESLIYDAPKGTTVTLVVQHGSVEITAPAVTSADADVGDDVQVLLKPSGRAFRTKLVAKDRALMVDP